MVIMVLITGREKIMGEFTVTGWLKGLGWVSAAAVMGVAVVAMIATSF